MAPPSAEGDEAVTRATLRDNQFVAMRLEM
jgi:hypothetical protein